MTAQAIKLKGRPDLNPYAPTSLAFHAFSMTRLAFERGDREEALRRAASYDRNLGMDLVKQVNTWK